MGGNTYTYVVPYGDGPVAAFEKLQAEEFAAGRYHPCYPRRTGKYLWQTEGEINQLPAVEPCHSSLDEMWSDDELAESGDGTNSILDMHRIVSTPFSPIVGDPYLAQDLDDRMVTAAPPADEELQALFQTTRPSLLQINSTLFVRRPPPHVVNFMVSIGRGMMRYIVAYGGEKPTQIIFIGVSFD